MSPIRRVPILNVEQPVYSRHHDTLDSVKREMRVEWDGDDLILVHEDARPTAPYFCKLNVEEIREILDERTLTLMGDGRDPGRAE